MIKFGNDQVWDLSFQTCRAESVGAGGEKVSHVYFLLAGSPCRGRPELGAQGDTPSCPSGGEAPSSLLKADQACEGLSLGHGVVGKVSRSSPRDHAWRHGPCPPAQGCSMPHSPEHGTPVPRPDTSQDGAMGHSFQELALLTEQHRSCDMYPRWDVPGPGPLKHLPSDR